MKRTILMVLALASPSAFSAEVSVPHTFTANTPAKAAEVNANFDAIAGGINDNHTRIDENAEASANNKAAIDAQNSKIDALGIDPLGASLSRELTGVVAVFANGTTVNGNGTLFNQELNVGDSIKIVDDVAKVISISSDTELELDTAHSVGAVNAAAYTDEDLLTLKNSADAKKFIVDKSGAMLRRIARNSGYHPVGNDTGPIENRTLTFKKRFDQDTSTIRIGYADEFRVLGQTKACTWEILANGVSCPTQQLRLSVYTNNASGHAINHHRGSAFFGYCDGLDAGVHKITVVVGSVPAYPNSDCATGWNTTWTLEAEEVLN